MKKTIKGFTLTELLAVVIIIAILSGMSIGGFRQAFERSNFSEGLQAGEAINEAVGRYYYDNLNLSSEDRSRPKVNQLDIGLNRIEECIASTEENKDYCMKTRYFEVEIEENGIVRAFRLKRGKRDSYLLEFSPDFASERKLETCITMDSKYTDLCKAMGYTSEGSGSGYGTGKIFSKPSGKSDSI